MAEFTNSTLAIRSTAPNPKYRHIPVRIAVKYGQINETQRKVASACEPAWFRSGKVGDNPSPAGAISSCCWHRSSFTGPSDLWNEGKRLTGLRNKLDYPAAGLSCSAAEQNDFGRVATAVDEVRENHFR